MELRPTLAWIVRSLRDRGPTVAVVHVRESGTRAIASGELFELVRRLAAGLTRAGVSRGDRIALVAPNGPEWIAAALAILESRAVIVPLDPQLEDHDIARIVAESKCRFAFASPEQAVRLARVDAGPPIRTFVLHPERESSPVGDALSFHSLVDPNEKPPALEEPGPDDLAAIFYTSGTTGPSKGVPLAHRNLASNVDSLLAEKLVGPSDRVLLPLPLFHAYPFTVGMLTPLASGSAIVIPRSLTGPEVVRALHEGEVTGIVGVPRIYTSLLAGIEARVRSRGPLAAAVFDGGLRVTRSLGRTLGPKAGRLLFRALHARIGPRVRLVASGGAPLDSADARTLEALGWQVCTGYGLTETGPILTFDPPRIGRLDSAGRPVRGVELRIHAPDAAGVGEVVARGPNVFAGYLDDPERTAKAFRDGWFRTGDLGSLDRDGFLRLSGRASESIVLADGKKIRPESLESALADGGSPIAEAAVLLHEGRLVAVIVREPANPSGDDAAGIRAAVRERSLRLPPYERILEYAVVREALPRTNLGKIRRFLLPEIFVRGRGEKPARSAPAGQAAILGADDDPIAAKTWDWLTARFPDSAIEPANDLRLDLGIDSLEWLSLTLELRDRIGLDLDEAALGRIHTVGDLLREASRTARAEPSAGAPEEIARDERHRWLEPLGPFANAASALLMASHRVLFRALFRLRVIGAECVPLEGPVILAPNHASDLDPFALAAALPWRRLRSTFWAGATERLFTGKSTRLLSRLGRVVPIDSKGSVRSSLAIASAVLGEKRQALVWFPEGQRSFTGELQPFLPGIGVLLERTRVPVVPVFIHETLEALPRGKRLARLRRLTVAFGAPLDARALESRGSGKTPAERIVSALHDAVADLGRRTAPRRPD